MAQPNVSVGQGGVEDSNENAVNPQQKPAKTFGDEGTNKTQPVPDPNAKPEEVPGLGKHVNPSPYTR